MSRQTSWQCLSLQEFFSLCNWQGQAEAGSLSGRWGAGEQSAPLPPRLSVPLPLGQTSWQCLSLQEFFSLCNWQGQAKAGSLGGRWGAGEQSASLPPRLSAPLPVGQTSWQCLSVQHFFSICNWQGQPLEKLNWHHADPSSRLKEQVREFFEFIPWEGNPEIGSLPKVTTIPVPISTPVEMTLTDLSRLF